MFKSYSNLFKSLIFSVFVLFNVRADSHHIKLIITPDFLTNDSISGISTKFSKYVSIANIILAKNTSQSWYFNGASDITVTTNRLYDQSIWPYPLSPATGYDYWIDVKKQVSPLYSGDGWASADSITGAAVCANTTWRQIYDWDALPEYSEDLQDFWRQMYIIMHEFGHVFGAGIGEYYSINICYDYTGIAPILNLNVTDLNDSYFSHHTDFYNDPLTMFNFIDIYSLNTKTKAQLISTTKYSNLTAAIMNGGYRQSVITPPDGGIHGTIIYVIHPNGTPWSHVMLEFYNKQGIHVYEDETNSLGQRIYQWENQNGTVMKSDNLRLIKVYGSDTTHKTAAYLSFWEIQEATLVNGQAYLIKTVVMP